MINKQQARVIAANQIGRKLSEPLSVYSVDEFMSERERIHIYNFNSLQQRWIDKSIWFVVYSKRPMAISSSHCMVVDQNTGEILAEFSLQDEG